MRYVWISARAVFSPTPFTPGSSSDGSPRRIANSAYRDAGTPYLASTVASSSSSSSETPRTVNSSRTQGSRTNWIRSRSPETISNRSSSVASTHNAPIASSASHVGAWACFIPVRSSTRRSNANCTVRSSGSSGRLAL